MERSASPPLQPPMLNEAAIGEVARGLTDRPALAVSDWQWRSVYGGLSQTTGGVYRVWGTGHDRDGEHPWSVVLKLVRPTGGSADPARFDYWRRELLVFQSAADLLPDPADGLAAPRCHAVGEDAGGYWLWLEEIKETIARPWPLARYGLAARHLGTFNGRFLAGRPLPRHSWLATGLLRSYVERTASGLARLAELADDPLGRRGWPADHLERMWGLWEEREALLAAVARLPRTLCHGDANDLNLLARTTPGGAAETVAIDWAFAGIGALGEDLTTLLRSTSGAATPGHHAALDDALFAGYLEGLGAVGWDGDPRLVRLAYTTAAAMRYALNPFPVAALADDTRRRNLERALGMPFEHLLDSVADFRGYCLGLADEARALCRAVMDGAGPGSPGGPFPSSSSRQP